MPGPSIRLLGHLSARGFGAAGGLALGGQYPADSDPLAPGAAPGLGETEVARCTPHPTAIGGRCVAISQRQLAASAAMEVRTGRPGA